MIVIGKCKYNILHAFSKHLTNCYSSQTLSELGYILWVAVQNLDHKGILHGI